MGHDNFPIPYDAARARAANTAARSRTGGGNPPVTANAATPISVNSTTPSMEHAAGKRHSILGSPFNPGMENPGSQPAAASGAAAPFS
jgi:hypothetical protein